jgi:HEPN domain-containing protein
MKTETKNWIKLAAEAYDDSLYLFKGARYPAAIYHMGQAIEKVLKAAQTEISEEIPKKTHNLERLGQKSGLDLSDNQHQILRELRKHYEKVRYRDFAQIYYNTKQKVAPIIKQGKTIYQWILTKLTTH